MKTIETIVFTSGAHRERFEELMKEQMVLRPKIFKREMAFLYVVSAMSYPFSNDLFHQRGLFPEIEKATKRRQERVLSDSDAVLYALAINIYNGLDIFSEMELEGSATPYHFFCQLGKESFLIGEASQIFQEGYPLDTIL